MARAAKIEPDLEADDDLAVEDIDLSTLAIDEDFAALDETMAASEDARPAPPERKARFAGSRFIALLVLALFVHAAIIAAFLWRDSKNDIQTARMEETPVEVIVEKPPEPEKPPPPPVKKPPEPPKPKEELEKPALSAPRAPNEEKLETRKTQPKTSVPKAPTPPSEGQPQPKPQIAQPKEAAPAETKDDVAKLEEDKTKPDAEALDKAKPKVAKQAKTKQAKAAPKRKQKAVDALASLAGASQLAEMTFAKPTPKSPVYGGTEDVRYLAIVEGMLEAKVQQLPRTAHWQAGGHTLIFFHIDASGRVISRDFYEKSGYPDIDQIAMRALLTAQPFPPPPPGVEHGLLWGAKFDGQLPRLTISRR